MSWAALLAFAALAVLVTAQSTPPPGAPTSITVQFIIRDFVGVCSACGVNGDTRNKTTHRDFERVIASDVGIVQTTLGADRKPVLNTSVVPATWTNATLFKQAWNDVPGVNLRLTRNFVMNWDTSQGLYVYNNGNFYPIDNDGYGNFYNNHNYHFCLEYHTQFKYRGTETFAFTGDDDVYFFVNNQLFVDLGGVHGAQSVTKDLKNTATALSQYGMSVGGVYNFDFFYCERHTSESNLKMATNILLNDCPFIDACGDCYVTATPSTVLVNPCNVLNCNNGVCNCRTANCTCNAGWTNGLNGPCTQNCGDGILQGNEQCDPPGSNNPCCSSTCQFKPANTTCPSLGKPCVNYVCTGTSSTCGIARSIGSACNGTTNAPQCQQYQCTSADGSTCDLVANNALTCTDNNACTTDVCASGVCKSTAQPCSETACRNAGVCDTTTGVCSQGSAKADGTGCGADPGSSSCVIPTCQAGTCNVNSPKPINTPCGSVSADGCSTQVCNGAGSCAPIAVTSAQGTKASCPQPGPGSCLQALCTGLACVNSSIADGSTCANASVTLNSCQRLGCVGGSCQAVADAAREGQSCTDNGALNSYGDDQCNMKVCSSGQCVRKVNTATDGNTCNIFASGPNPEPTCRTYTCSAGTCTRSKH
uniref:Predicted protein n=1 Tax=Hordeum vulgare subsp. vulgare TaxID=112509 RepID=F2DST9_HORVV|nr:predicted protein [Hordeum vulgare subsp. vulgare]